MGRRRINVALPGVYGTSSPPQDSARGCDTFQPAGAVKPLNTDASASPTVVSASACGANVGKQFSPPRDHDRADQLSDELQR